MVKMMNTTASMVGITINAFFKIYFAISHTSPAHFSTVVSVPNQVQITNIPGVHQVEKL